VIIFALKMEPILSSETSLPSRTTRRLIPEDDILQNLLLAGLHHCPLFRKFQLGLPAQEPTIFIEISRIFSCGFKKTASVV
jgi:hypothetical protein